MDKLIFLDLDGTKEKQIGVQDNRFLLYIEGADLKQAKEK
jgi:hypothetical protein